MSPARSEADGKTQNWRLGCLFLPAFLVEGIGTLLVAKAVVEFVHLVLVYGLRPVADGTIYFASTKPHLIVSNGDHLTGLQAGVHLIAIPVLWFGQCIPLLLFTGRWIDKWTSRPPKT